MIYPALRFVGFWAVLSISDSAATPSSERQYLSGSGPKDAVPWEFSVTGGRRAGEWTTIPVPSNWELQGFGTYNYGQEPAKAAEHGLYRHRFTVPERWKNRRVRLVFEGVMTDVAVTLNGSAAGPAHIGGFYQFSYDITSLLKPGMENVLEVDVAKASGNRATEVAERQADYWVFGGIYRPVYLEAAPAESIEHAAIDARADGTLTVALTLPTARTADRVEAQVFTSAGQPVDAPFFAEIPGGGTGRLELATRIKNPRWWTAETPHLYTVRLTLQRAGESLHTMTARFGFRTFEASPRTGFLLNGQRILLKGVNRHSFRPETGRALTREDCYADVRLIKAMNMNAVRMSHYPPDEAFLEACDELGLYVLNELSGWQNAHETEVGRRLVREMVTRDVNHPSILFWDNGNEGGFNRELDAEFARYDPQRRRVLHPWEPFDGINTKHYSSYDDLAALLRGPNLVMPTETLHGLYDGGAGAGLEDYWKLISGSPFGAGAFIWVLADEGVVRTDQNNRVDVFSTFAPDGIVGPHHEKEGSFYTIRDLWSPVQIERPVLDGHFDGTLLIQNRYDFTPLSQCGFRWQLLRHRTPDDNEIAPLVIADGIASAPLVGPHQSGKLKLSLPENWREADALAVVAVGPDRQELWKWIWPVPPRLGVLPPTLPVKLTRETTVTEVLLQAGDLVVSLDRASGMLREVRRGKKSFALAQGPSLSFARPSSAGPIDWLPLGSAAVDPLLYPLDAPQTASAIEIEIADAKSAIWTGFKLEILGNGGIWKTLYESSRRVVDRTLYEFSPQTVTAVRLSNLRRSDGKPAAVKSVRLGYAPARFPAAPMKGAVVNTGSSPEINPTDIWVESRAAGGFDWFRWTLQNDGALRLDYRYSLTGEFAFHGITFEHPTEKMTAFRWLGEGPYRVWKNRLRGTSLGVHEIACHELPTGESWDYPESQGYFAGLRWARFETTAGRIHVASASPEIYLRVGTPRINHPLTTAAFPGGEISFLHAIPPIGSKFRTPEQTGPASRWAQAEGVYEGSLTFRFGE